ncbi:hypothetical protein Tco_0656736 [Tanacetum coccineum]|uniref:Uncharacterized protein n=1 Tax=Tanacetum coccineum TaxID=301880 RepID=A0ABQ4X9K9_9ASTR
MSTPFWFGSKPSHSLTLSLLFLNSNIGNFHHCSPVTRFPERVHNNHIAGIDVFSEDDLDRDEMVFEYFLIIRTIPLFNSASIHSLMIRTLREWSVSRLVTRRFLESADAALNVLLRSTCKKVDLDKIIEGSRPSLDRSPFAVVGTSLTLVLRILRSSVVPGRFVCSVCMVLLIREILTRSRSSAVRVQTNVDIRHRSGAWKERI